ncbi:MAG TPA: NUDIX domain-containing protein [Terracidiphilus sp.]|nr:NUDIX domain-containing protein [Terracidiphilus sp.]
MPRKSAGILLYRVRNGELEILAVHPGGPFWVKRDLGSWFIPKGEIEPGEDEFAAAKREFQEETGFDLRGPFLDLGEVRHKGGKIVHAWAAEGDCDPAQIVSNTFTIEWPPKSGRRQSFPEVDRAVFFRLPAARQKLHPAEFELVERLNSALNAG